MSLSRRVARLWLPLAVAVTLLSALIYVVTQQVYRMSADSPQVQIAEDVPTALSRGATPDSVVGSATVDVAASLAPFIVVLDASGSPVAGSARLDGKLPAPPKGVLDFARTHDENRVTWQPRAGVRVASVTRAIDGGAQGFVFVGRSLREAERLIDTLGQLVLAGWLATLVATFLAVLALELLGARRG